MAPDHWSKKATKVKVYLQSDETFKYRAASADFISWQATGNRPSIEIVILKPGMPNFSETWNKHGSMQSKPVQGTALGQVPDLILGFEISFWLKKT